MQLLGSGIAQGDGQLTEPRRVAGGAGLLAWFRGCAGRRPATRAWGRRSGAPPRRPGAPLAPTPSRCWCPSRTSYPRSHQVRAVPALERHCCLAAQRLGHGLVCILGGRVPDSLHRVCRDDDQVLQVRRSTSKVFVECLLFCCLQSRCSVCCEDGITLPAVCCAACSSSRWSGWVQCTSAPYRC